MKTDYSAYMTTADVQRQTRIIVFWIVVTQAIFALVMLALFGGLFITQI
ncbi:MAG: hypothetical protein OXG84_05990 [Chloroflexi bacterium]|nr:hypothetical protein [Chloroflexota bacterium]